MSKRPIIIDTDPGIDDALAIAIALFSEELEVRLITTVAGNVSLENVTQNTLRLLSFFGKDVPVAMGAAQPLIADFVDASNVHGKTGMEGYDFPEPKKELLLKEHAVNAMRRDHGEPGTDYARSHRDTDEHRSAFCDVSRSQIQYQGNRHDGRFRFQGE